MSQPGIVREEGTPGTGRTEDHWRRSAQEIAHGVATGEFSALEATESCLARIEAVNPAINAVVEVMAEAALEAAERADREVASGADLGSLHGVPVLTKVNSDQVGTATTDGIVALKDNIATADSPQIANLRGAGAILVGRTNVPAFSMRFFSTNDLHGRTLNPWDRSRTPGGSSGGAAAAVAAGLAPIGQGNDIGGSIRYPAYACGVVGLRPTVGRVAKKHHPDGFDAPLSEQLMTVDGPIARTIGDLRLALKVGAGADPRDPIHVPGAPSAPPAGTRTVALVREAGGVANAACTNRALDDAAGWLADVGYAIEEVELPLLWEAYRLFHLLVMEEVRANVPLIEELADEGMRLATQGYYEFAAELHGKEPSLQDYIDGYSRRGTLIEQLGQFMGDHPLVLLPNSTEAPAEQDADIAGPGAAARLLPTQWPMLSVPLLGFPALSVPTGLADGLPAGVQLLGRRFDEEAVLRAGEVIEARAGRLTPIDPVHDAQASLAGER